MIEFHFTYAEIKETYFAINGRTQTSYRHSDYAKFA